MLLDLFSNIASIFPEILQPVVITVLKAITILVPLILGVAYSTYWERKIIGWMQNRKGPNRVGPMGLFQPFADVIKLMFKEIIVPTNANKFLFVIAPFITLVTAFAAWAVVPVSSSFAIANVNASALYVLALTSLGVYGIILAGWATNSKYAFMGAMRSAAQMVAYEIAMGFALIGVFMAADSLNFGEIVAAQQGGVHRWFWVWLFPLFIVYFISGVAETNRAPFDVAEGESEIVAGFHVEYSGITFALFFLAEYANMILIAALTALMFMGGWLSPFEGVPFIGESSALWLILKMAIIMFIFFWLRATFPRYRYDQIMRLGWKVFIPVTLVWIAVLGIMFFYKVGPWAGKAAAIAVGA